MNIVNLTPHPLKVMAADGTYREWPKATVAPRLATTLERVGQIDGIDVVKTAFGATTDLPEATADTILVVSRLVKDANPERTDLVCPGEALRDETGKVVGARGFSV